MTIKQIYQKYQIPPNLQLHMKRAGAVGAFIIDHWSSPEPLEESAIIEALLLHDMGNVIKFDFALSHLLGEEEVNIQFWKAVQLRFKQKYTDEHTATLEIAKEIGVSPATFTLLEWTGSSKLEQIIDINDWSAKVTCYCDFRVSPYGIVGVNERFDDLIKRYHGRSHDLGDIEKTQRRRLFCLDLQKQLQTMIDFDLEQLTDREIEIYLKQVEKISLPAPNLID